VCSRGDRDVHAYGRAGDAGLDGDLEIDLGNADDVGAQLTALAGQSPDLVTADLTGTVFRDSAGVYVLTRAPPAG
jgi:hypothetical protein